MLKANFEELVLSCHENVVLYYDKICRRTIFCCWLCVKMKYGYEYLISKEEYEVGQNDNK